MNNLILVSGRTTKDFIDYAQYVASECLKLAHQPTGLEVSIKFVSKKEIQQLNKRMRNIDKVTDVLSFPSTEIKAGEILDLSDSSYCYFVGENEMFHFGDMAICTQKMCEQAKEYQTTAKQELKKLVIHSMLHLMGYDHIKDSDFEIMNKKEIEFSKKIN